jgi:hypothetical protein
MRPYLRFGTFTAKTESWFPTYCKFPKEAVLRGSGRDLRRALADLPEDIYLFDDSFDWSFILIHEHDDKRRICIAAGKAYSVER